LGIGDSRADTVVLLFSALAVIIAGTLSMATISNNNSINHDNAGNPLILANQAAKAGMDAAKWHIECHGRTAGGGLAPRYYVNGALYSATWGDVDLNDSTVIVETKGSYRDRNNKLYSIDLKNEIKVDFLPAHNEAVLSSYYSKNKTAFHDRFMTSDSD